MWTLAWNMAPQLPTELKDNLGTLIRPTRDASGSFSSIIPIYDSRTSPIIGEVASPKLALESDIFDLKSSSSGDEVSFHIAEHGTTSPKILLDFPLVRQAMSCNAGWIGVTEVSDDMSPRLERFRSARLVPGQLGGAATYVVVNGSKQHAIQVGTR